MQFYPLIFSFRDLIAGNGYIAYVELDSYAIMTNEDNDLVSLEGVHLSVGARGINASVALFKKSYRRVLFHHSAIAGSTADLYSALLTDLQPQTDIVNRWKDLLNKRVHSTSRRTNFPSLRPPACSLDRHSRLHVVEVTSATAHSRLNQFDQIFEAI